MCSGVGVLVAGIGAVQQLASFKPGEDLFEPIQQRWITATGVFTLCTNVYSSSVIVWTIWRANRAIARVGRGNLKSTLGIVIESAFLYAAWTLLWFVSFEVGSNIQLFFVDVTPPVAGIAFMLINVRVGLGFTKRSLSTDSGIAPVSIVARFTRQTEQVVSGPGRSETYTLRPLSNSPNNSGGVQKAYEESLDVSAASEPHETGVPTKLSHLHVFA